MSGWPRFRWGGWSTAPHAPSTATRDEDGARRTILVTGAAGAIATAIRPLLAGRFALRLSDQHRVAPGPHESFMRADLQNAAAVSRAVAGVDAVIHLGALAKEDDLSRLLGPNVLGSENVLRAAVTAGVPHVVLASSMHVLGLYHRDEPVGPDSAPRPDSRYALTKLMTEELGRLYAFKHGLHVTSVRIGCFKATREESEPGAWIGPADLAALLDAIVNSRFQATDGRPAAGDFEIVHAVTDHPGDDSGQRDLSARLGFRFQHPGRRYDEEMATLPDRYPDSPVAQRYRGGEFASARLDDTRPTSR